MVYTIVQLNRQHSYNVQAKSQDIKRIITERGKKDMIGRKSMHKPDINGQEKSKKKDQ